MEAEDLPGAHFSGDAVYLSQAPTSLTVRQRVKSRDPLYLFVCHLEWRCNKDVKAYQELIAALDDPDQAIRKLAEMLLHRPSPRPPSQRTSLHSVDVEQCRRADAVSKSDTSGPDRTEL